MARSTAPMHPNNLQLQIVLNMPHCYAKNLIHVYLSELNQIEVRSLRETQSCIKLCNLKILLLIFHANKKNPL